MPAFRFQCPGCQAVLKNAGPVEAGKKIRSPKCTTLFQLAAPPPAAAALQEEPSFEETRARRRRDDDYDDEPPRKRRRRDEEDEPEDLDEEDRPRRRKRRKKAASLAPVLWLMLGGVGLLVLFGGGLTLLWALGGFIHSRIVGRWTPDNPIAQGAIIYDFRGDGTFTFLSIWVGNLQFSGTYSVSGNTLTLMPNQFNAQGVNFPGARPQMGQIQMQIESVSATQLVLSGGRQIGQKRTVLKRAD
jgi:hypothetical protein